MFCILICGYRRSGKNTLADAICGSNGYHFNTYSKVPVELHAAPRVAFADILKLEVAKLRGVSLEEIEKYKDTGPCYRNDLISIAAKYRAEDPRWFCRHLFAKQTTSCIITDWRYPNEYEEAAAWCLSHDAKLITIRVINSAVKIPEKDVFSEHSLDDFLVDVIALPELDILNKIISRDLCVGKIGA